MTWLHAKVHLHKCEIPILAKHTSLEDEEENSVILPLWRLHFVTRSWGKPDRHPHIDRGRSHDQNTKESSVWRLPGRSVTNWPTIERNNEENKIKNITFTLVILSLLNSRLYWHAHHYISRFCYKCVASWLHSGVVFVRLWAWIQVQHLVHNCISMISLWIITSASVCSKHCSQHGASCSLETDNMVGETKNREIWSCNL